MKTDLSRRSFLRTTSLAAGATLAARAIAPAHAAPVGSNDAIRIGIIGLNKGSGHLKTLLQMPDVRVAGLCDLHPAVLARVAKSIPEAKGKPFLTTDARELIARQDIDAVMVVACNHWHALLTIWACQAGKDVYVEKPMSRTVWEEIGRAHV